MNSLKRKHITEKNKLEEIRRLLIHNSFIGNYLHDKSHMNVHDTTKVTNSCTIMSTTFEHKKLQLKQTFVRLEQPKNCNRHKNEDSKKLLKKMSLPQEDENT